MTDRWLRWLGIRLLPITIGLTCLGACHRPYETVSGTTMGTRFEVEADCPGGLDRTTITSVLDDVDSEMSTYRSDSALSVFNAAPVGAWVTVSPQLVHVVVASQELAQMSGGAFDVTVAPLVAAWGFGPDAGVRHEPPTAAALANVLRQVGHAAIEVRRAPPALRKLEPRSIDLSAIAKGHAVDRVREALLRAGCTDMLVFVGGEIAVAGTSADGDPWQLGIEAPDGSGAVLSSVELRSGALATSGDYRNFRVVGGRPISHTIDPRTGAPVDHALGSVTVVHESAMWADGLATAINVLGPQAGLALADAYDVAATLVVRGPDGLQTLQSRAMTRDRKARVRDH